MCVNYAANMIE